uniref:Uncharacterized protein n=1 Tax=Oryza barthii TaxID=65489 RepID=A0A0D3FFI4_9ORYZ
MPPISRLDPRYHRARGLHELNRLMSLRREQRHLQIETYQFLAQCAKRKESPCQQDNSQCVKRMRYSGPDLPEDIWHHIHSLLPLQDAARAACVSQAFLRFWRCHPNLIFSWKTMGLNKVPHKKGGIVRDYNNKVDRIMKNHSGGIKTFSLELHPFSNANTYYHLNSWLEIAITSGIKELTLVLTSNEENFHFEGKQAQFSLEEPVRLKNLEVVFPNNVCYARVELPFSMPDIETLNVILSCEMVDTPTGPGKFLHLRYLMITFATWRFSWAYDYFSLASFLDASPSLETFILCISQKEKHDLTFKDPICLRQIPEHRHDKLKNVKITGFSATRAWLS